MRDFFRFAFVVMMLLVAAGCGEQQPPAAAEVPELMSFTIDGMSYEMQMPARRAHVTLFRTADSVKISASTSKMHYIELMSARDEPGERFDRKEALKNGSRLDYRVNYDLGGGMHGTEGELVGRMEIAGRVLSVTCRDQKDPWPEWCFPYIGTLAVVAPPR